MSASRNRVGRAATLALIVGFGAACGGDDGASSNTAATGTPPGAAPVPAATTGATAPVTPGAMAPVTPGATAPITPGATNPSPAAASSGVEVREGSNPCQGEALPAVAAFDAASGDVRWSVCSNDEAYRTVLGATDVAAYLAEGVEGSTQLVAYDAADGEELWRRPMGLGGGGGVGWPKGPIAGDGVIVVADGPQDAPQLVGLDARTGEERWLIDGGAVTVNASPPPGTLIAAPTSSRRWSPLAGTEHVVVLVSSFGEIAGLDRISGTQRWDVVSPGGGDESGDVAGLAAAAVLDDTIMIPAGDETVAIDAGTGAELWRGQRLDDPWAADGHVVGVQPSLQPGQGPSEIAALDAHTGAAASVFPGAESYGDRLAVGDGGAFVLDPDDHARIIGYDLATGAVRWTGSTDAYLGEPQVVQDDVVVTLWEETLAALATRDGTVRWAWQRPLGTDWMNTLDTNAATVFVAVNSLPFAD